MEANNLSDTLIFLGTGGARVVVANQFLASGGIWMSLSGTEILVDPGPGCIVQSTKRKLKAEKLSAIVLTHRHLDHSGDVNIMVEAMASAGFKKPHGWLFAPSDALDNEPVIFSYLRSYLEGIQVLQEGKSYSIDGISITTPIRHIHGVETYGMVIKTPKHTFSYIADTRYFDGLADAYSGDVIILNVVFLENGWPFDHLAASDAKTIIQAIKPKAAILTHFGTTMWRAHPWEIAEKMSQETGIRVIAARDGMKFDLGQFDIEAEAK